MSEWSANSSDRVRAVWDKLLGLFGDAQLRKFGADPPREWEAALGYVNYAQIERGFRRLVFGWKGGPPSLPDFMRLCRTIGDDTMDEGLRQESPRIEDGRKFDGWDVTGNNRFLKYVTTRLSRTPRAWGAASTPEQAEATMIAVGYKNAWARDMREESTPDGFTMSGEAKYIAPPLDRQNSTWKECMRRAEEEIAALPWQESQYEPRA